MRKELPNILLIVTDQLRSDCVGCYQGYPVKTPNLDALAAEGMIFEQAYTPLPVCCPARQSMISSRRPERNGGLWNYPYLSTGWLDPSDVFWPNQLKDAGYKNYYFGKWHVSPEHNPLDFGYDKYVDYDDYIPYREKVFGSRLREGDWLGEIDPIPLEQSPTHWFARLTEEQIEACATSAEPWHIRLDYIEPHLPCRPCKEFYDLYRDEEIPEWEGFRETFEDKPYIQKQQLYTWGLENYGWTEWSEIVRRYYAIISQIDDAVGRVIRKLKETGQWENTLVLFTSDHGDMCGSHGMIDKHYVMYDDVVHVPFIAAWQGKIPAGTRNDQFIYQALDLGPTLIELIGGRECETDGKSILKLMYGEKPEEWRQEVVSTYNGQQFGLYTQRMLRTREWKYIWNTTDVDELYDLVHDPGELHNLIHDPKYQEMIKEYRKRLYEILIAEGDDLVSSTWLADQLNGKVKKL